MANELPLTIQGSAVPPNVRWTPAQLAEFVWSKARIVTSASYALFVTGSTEPSSNVGPWLKNSETWYIWSAAEGGYVPQVLPPESLGYSIGSSAPDPLIFNFWIETTVGGSPLALKIFYSGAWVDVYAAKFADYLTITAAAATYLTIADFNTDIANYSTTAQMNTAIAAGDAATLTSANAYTNAQIAGIPAANAGKAVFGAFPSADQDFVHGGAGTYADDVAFGSESFDPDGVFGSSIFTAPATGYYQFLAVLQFGLQAGSPANLNCYGELISSAGDSTPLSGIYETGTGNRFSSGGDIFFLNSGQTVKVVLNQTIDAAATIRVTAAGSKFSGVRLR